VILNMTIKFLINTIHDADHSLQRPNNQLVVVAILSATALNQSHQYATNRRDNTNDDRRHARVHVTPHSI
jgi:hypothetical protein